MKALIVCVKRKPGLTPEEFYRHYGETHARLVMSCPDFARHLHSYVQHHAVDSSSPVAAMFGASGEYDAVAVLTFKSERDLTEAFAEQQYFDHIQPDEAKFVDHANCLSFITDPVVAKPAGGELFSLAGKIAVVTGGARGIGAMITTALLDAGAEVIVIARGRLPAELADRPGCTLLEHDLSTIDGIRAAATAVQAQTPAVNILVNNAGTFTAAPLDQIDDAQWDRELAINLRAPFFMVQSLLPALKAASRECDPARVINIGSIGALWAKSSSAYADSASKGGVHQLTRTLASDLTRQGVTVNALAPGFFPSNMTAGFFDAVPGLKDQVIESIPAHRLGAPEDIGGAAVFLSSAAGAYVSGAILPIEGGLWSA